jgi:CPW-WPC domain-containing protein
MSRIILYALCLFLSFSFEGCFSKLFFKTKPKIISQGIPPDPNALVDELFLSSPIDDHYLRFTPVKGAKEEILSKFAFLNEFAVISMINEAVFNFKNANSIDESAFTCMRDYSGCPPGWPDLGNGEDCLPSDGYPQRDDENCSGKGILKYTVRQKLDFESTCDVKFPCYDSCVPDYRIDCPLGYFFDSLNGLCIDQRPLSILKICLSPIDLRWYDTYMRKQFEKMCDVKWPCRSTGKIAVSINS